jgi:RNA polymerase sigma-70 factor (ECF subfamily)
MDEQSAQDALQEVFLALLDRGKKAVWIDNLRAYLLGIARNVSGRARRRRSRETQVCTDGGGCELAASPAIEVGTEALDILRDLPREQAEVVVMKVWHDLTFVEIGQVLHISQNTAASRYRYALNGIASSTSVAPLL